MLMYVWMMFSKVWISLKMYLMVCKRVVAVVHRVQALYQLLRAYHKAPRPIKEHLLKVLRPLSNQWTD